MRAFSRWALASLPLAGLFYGLGRLEGGRMAAVGQGFEMAFYWSPLRRRLARPTVALSGRKRAVSRFYPRLSCLSCPSGIKLKQNSASLHYKG